VAIVITGILLFFIFGFKPHQEEKAEQFKIQILILLFITSIISLPLFVSIINLSNQVSEKKFILEHKKEIFGDNVFISEIEVKNIYGVKKTNILLVGEYYTDDDLEKIKIAKENLKKKIDKKFKINSEISLKLSRVVKLK
jgi:uncharacterized membrane protein